MKTYKHTVMRGTKRTFFPKLMKSKPHGYLVYVLSANSLSFCKGIIISQGNSKIALSEDIGCFDLNELEDMPKTNIVFNIEE